jgi:hypothetical protein
MAKLRTPESSICIVFIRIRQSSIERKKGSPLQISRSKLFTAGVKTNNGTDNKSPDNNISQNLMLNSLSPARGESPSRKMKQVAFLMLNFFRLN